jgi:hypothetical protein
VVKLIVENGSRPVAWGIGAPRLGKRRNPAPTAVLPHDAA